MAKHVHVYALMMLVSCTLCKGQNQTDLPRDDVKSETKGQITSFGPSTSVRTIKQDRKGNIWLASNEGIIRYDGKSFTNITGKTGLNRFFSVLEDRKGNFWFGNNGLGVYYYDPKRAVGESFQNFTTGDGLVSNNVLSIYEDRSGNIWFITREGVSRYDGKSFRNLTTKEGLSNNDVTTILEDKTGKFWFGTRRNTFVYDGKTCTVFTDKAFKDVWSIIEDKKGNVWLGGGEGLWCYDGSTFTNFTENFVYCIYEDKKGNIWTSGRNLKGIWELSRYDKKSLSDKKPIVIEVTQSLNLFGILEANDGSIWFGSFDGVYRYDGNTIADFKR